MAVDSLRQMNQRSGETCRSVWSVLKDCPGTVVIPCQATSDIAQVEGVETKPVTSKNNLAHERAAPVSIG